MYKSKYISNKITSSQAIPFELEKKLINSMLHGKIDDALAIINEILLFNVGDLHYDEQRFLLATLISFCSRKLISKGTTRQEAFSIQQEYFYAISHSNDIGDIHDILEDVIIFYTSYFDHIQKNSYSYHVQRVLNYIEDNLQGKLTVTAISENLGLNNAYLSALFKEETGQSIKKKITETKIDYAKELLNSSNKTINEISNILGFSSQSLFAQRFKEVESLSPTEYRSLFNI